MPLFSCSYYLYTQNVRPSNRYHLLNVWLPNAKPAGHKSTEHSCTHQSMALRRIWLQPHGTPRPTMCSNKNGKRLQKTCLISVCHRGRTFVGFLTGRALFQSRLPLKCCMNLANGMRSIAGPIWLALRSKSRVSTAISFLHERPFRRRQADKNLVG